MKNSLLLCVSALLLTALLISCGEAKTDAPVTTQAAAETAATEIVTTEEPKLEPDLPERDFDGYEFRVLTKGVDNVHWKSKDIYTEEQNGEALNDAVFERNSKVGEKYNFIISEKITNNGTWNLYSDVRKTVLAGEDVYDMAAIGLATDIRNLAADGMLLDLHTIPYLDLTKPWYDQNANAQMSIANKLYATVGDMVVMDDEATLVVLFNKKLAEEFGVGDLYESVRSGKWTLDVLHDAMIKSTADLDGDGQHTEFDQWGVIGESGNTYMYMASAGVSMIEKDAKDIPRFKLDNDRIYAAFEKAMSINGDFDYCMYASNFNSKYTNDVFGECFDPAFSGNRVLFNTAGLVRVTVFRAMDTDFGLLPMPKFDEDQEEYRCAVSVGCANSITVPASATDPERTGIIIEALSAESKYTVAPAFYETTLRGKAIRDDESEETLDIILGNRIFDLAQMYDWGTLVSSINTLTTNKSHDIASSIASNLPKAETALQTALDAFEKLN